MKKIRMGRKGRKIRSIIAGVAVLALLGWFASLKINLEAQVNNYDFVVPLETRDISQAINTNGTVVMCYSSVITADVSQKVKTVHVRAGDMVRSGDVLCEFESGNIDDQISKLEKLINDTRSLEQMSDSNSANSVAYAEKSNEITLQRASVSLDAAKKEYDIANSKYGEYYSKYMAASEQADIELYYGMYKKYETSLDSLQKNIDACQMAYDNAKFQANQTVDEAHSQNDMQNLQISDTAEYEKNLEQLNKEKENLIIRATEDGVISDCFVCDGMYPENRELFKMGQLGKYKIDAKIFSKDILNIHEGMEAVFTTQLTGSDEIKGKVTNVSEVYTDGAYHADIEIDDPEMISVLKPNIDAFVRILVSNKEAVKAVSYDSVFTGEDGNCYVYRAREEKNGEYKAEAVKVEKGVETDYYVEIISSELSDGDLIVGSAEEHSSGDKIKIKGMTE